MGRIAGRGTNKLQNKLYRAGLSLGVFAGTFVLAFVAASLLTPVDSSSAADSGSASTTVTYDFAPTIDISLSKANVDFNISANEFNKLKTDSLNVTVSTNNITGYTLNMTTDSSATNGATIVTEESGFEAEQLDIATNALVNTTNNRHYIPSITSSITNPTDSTFPVNSWGYSISSTPTNMVYNPLPTAGSSAEIKKVTELDFPTDGSEASVDGVTPVTIATKADMSIPAGTYTNKLVFTAITNFNGEYDNYNIVYNSNNGEGDMTMVSHSAKLGDSIMLYAPNYWRTGYGFLGWSTNPNATKYVPSTQSNLNSREAYIYGPNETVTVSDAAIASANSDGIITLYAIWKASEGNMQSWTGCSAMSIGDVTALTDTRDNNVYTIAKLADGKCWLSENLRLSSGAVDSTNTNNPISNFTWASSTNSWCKNSNSSCMDKVLVNTNNVNSRLNASPIVNNNSSSWYGYGVIYGWYAATAGRGTYSMTSGKTSGDICPSGWHLPTSTSSGEFQSMYTDIGEVPSNIYKYPNNFVLSGGWNGNTAYNRRLNGYYWSSTVHNNNFAYHLNIYSGVVNPSSENYKYFGRSVRCVADVSSYTINYNANSGSGTMTNTHTNVKTGDSITLVAPNFSRTGYGFLGWSTNPNAASTTNATIYGPEETISAPSSYGSDTLTLYAIWKQSAGDMQGWKGCSSMSIGDVTALTDTRDGNVYAVAKLADGKCWSVENLRLSSGAIDSTTTNNPAPGFALGSSSTSWCTSQNSACYNQSLWNNTNVSDHYAYGNYYSWFAATAGNGKYETASGDTVGDICPLGWHLPTSTSSGEFQAMYSAAGSSSAAIRKSPYNFVLSGLWSGSSVYNRGSYGDYWSSTAYDNNYAYRLDLNSSYVYPSNDDYKRNGPSVRCIAG